MKKAFYTILTLVALLLLWSCSTKKNTKASRFYHAFNSRYNIYFNGKTAFDESLQSMIGSYKDNYSDQILLYPVSALPKDKAEPGGPFDRAIEKSNKAIKLHSIKAKPRKKPGWRNDPKQRALQEQEEYNPFLKKCWLLMGQAQFYNGDFLQASATFSYIIRHYAQEEEVVAEARLWQARCYAEMGWLFESETILSKLNTNGIPRKQLDLYASVYADHLIKDQKYEDAIPYLKTAIKAEKNKLQRKRMKYLLGQLYANLGIDGLAYRTFGEVARSNPPYELEFAARIRQTEVFTGGNYQKVVKMLERMGKSQKNKDYLDQVYYALGNVYLSREDTAAAIRNYQLGIEKSTRDGIDKAICQIRLGDLYFSMRDYIHAQPCFSGALAGLQKEYKDYERVSKLSAVLDELVVHAEAVHLQDSLQTLARMPEPERLAVIDNIIENLKKEEEEAKALAEKEAYLADQEARGTGIDRAGTELNPTILPVGGSGTGFYFYNPQTVAQGKTQFQRKWGRRPLEDHWRRRKKQMSTFLENKEEDAIATTDSLRLDAEGNPLAADSLESGLPPVAADDPHTREYYLQQLPFTAEDVAASNLIIADGLYHMAMIYKDKLNDLPLSISAFEDLERRFPDNEHLLESYYQVYLMALRTGDKALAGTYKAKLNRKFPESDYAVAVADPNYEYNIRMMNTVQDSIYERTYHRYLAGDTAVVRRNYRQVSVKYPLAELLPKFMFLDALTYVQAGDPEGFKQALKALVEKYPEADVTELAGEMLKGVLRGRALVQGSVTGMTWNLRFGVGDDGTLSAADSARTFTAEPNTPYRMLLVYPTGSVDKNQLLFAVAAYNFANFMVKEFDLSFREAGPVTLFEISGFVNLEEAVYYYGMIYGKDGYGAALDKGVMAVPISEDNYETLMRGKTLDEYISFFAENFGEKAPELVARWKARMEAAEEEAAAEGEKREEAVTGEAPAEAAEAVAGELVTPETVRPQEEAVAPPVDDKPSSPKEEQPAGKAAPSVPDTQAEGRVLASDSVQAPVSLLSDTVAAPSVPALPKAPRATDSLAVQPKDSIPAAAVPTVDEGLTLEEIREIREREAAEEAARLEEARKAFEAKQKAEKEQEEQRAKEREALRKQQAEEEKALLEAKAEREKQLERDRKAKLKQAEADRKAKLKARRQALKEKERAYKQRLKQKEKERREKEQAYKKKLKAKEKARREALKEKEAAARKR